MSQHQPWKAHLAVITTNIIFGINFSVVQYITHKFMGSFGLNVLRVGVSSLLLWTLWIFSKKKAGIRKEHVGRFILCALTGVFINQSLFIKGVSMTLNTHASLLILVTPVFISIVAAWTGSEPLNIFKMSGLVTAIVGAVILVANKEAQGTGNNILWGDIFIIINAISYAFFFSLAKPLMKIYDPIHVIRWVFSIGLLFMLPIGWAEFTAIPWKTLVWNDFAALTLVVVGATFIAYLFNLYGVHHLGASVTGAYIYTQPIFASVIAVWFLHEVFSVTKLIAALLIACGVLLVNFKPAKKIQQSSS